jgi:hypothetical protein
MACAAGGNSDAGGGAWQNFRRQAMAASLSKDSRAPIGVLDAYP